MDKQQLYELFEAHKNLFMERAIFELKLYDWQYVPKWDCAEFTLFAEKWLDYHFSDGYYLLVALLDHFMRKHTPKLILKKNVPYITELEKAAQGLITRLKQCLVIGN